MLKATNPFYLFAKTQKKNIQSLAFLICINWGSIMKRGQHLIACDESSLVVVMKEDQIYINIKIAVQPLGAALIFCYACFLKWWDSCKPIDNLIFCKISVLRLLQISEIHKSWKTESLSHYLKKKTYSKTLLKHNLFVYWGTIQDVSNNGFNCWNVESVFVRRCATSFMTGPDQLSQCDRHNNSFINLLRTDSDGKVLQTDSRSYCQRLCPPRPDADCWLRWGVDTRRLEHGDR